jgi:hypothetical protein
MTTFNWIQSHWAPIATILWLLSELLGETARFKSNSILGLIRDFFKKEAAKVKSNPEGS